MSEHRFSGWAVLLAVFVVLGVAVAALAGGFLLGYGWGRAAGRSAALRTAVQPGEGLPFQQLMPFGQQMPFERMRPQFPQYPFGRQTPYGPMYPFGGQVPSDPDLPDQQTEPAIPEQQPAEPRREAAALPYLGVGFQSLTPALAAEHDLSVSQGAWITEVIGGSPAAQADLQVGDVIQAVDDQRVNADQTLADLILQHQPGDQVELRILRGDRTRSLSIELGERP